MSPKTAQKTKKQENQKTDSPKDKVVEEMEEEREVVDMSALDEDGNPLIRDNEDELDDLDLSEDEEQDPAAAQKAVIKELKDKHLRTLAEFDNFKRRSQQEYQSRLKFASQNLILNIIPGLDNLERALKQAKESDNEKLAEFVKGVEMVQQQFLEAFKNNNIKRTYPLGETFDPNKHEAMGVMETDEYEPDQIAMVYQAGYSLHDRTIRPAMVQVAKGKN